MYETSAVFWWENLGVLMILRRPWTTSGSSFFFVGCEHVLFWRCQLSFCDSNSFVIFWRLNLQISQQTLRGWEELWSKEKQDYCCTHFNQACDRFDCDYLQSRLDAEICFGQWRNESDDFQVFRKRWNLVKRLWILIQWHLQGKLRLAKICHLHSHSIPILLPTKHLNIQNILCQKSSWKPDPEWFSQPSQPFGPSVSSLQVIARNCGRRRNSPGALDSYGCNIWYPLVN